MESVALGSADGDVSNKEGFTMRWSRIRKTVEIKEAQVGLIRSSISSAKFDAETKGKGGGVEKVILNDASGAAFPGTCWI